MIASERAGTRRGIPGAVTRVASVLFTLYYFSANSPEPGPRRARLPLRARAPSASPLAAIPIGLYIARPISLDHGDMSPYCTRTTVICV